MFIVKGGTTTVTHEVELVQGGNGVGLFINGVKVLRLDDDFDEVIMCRGVTKEQTGLDGGPGNRAQACYCWDSDLASRKDYKRSL